MAPEDMVGDNRWQCRPGVRVDAEKGMTLRRLPPVLTLHLKRCVPAHGPTHALRPTRGGRWWRRAPPGDATASPPSPRFLFDFSTNRRRKVLSDFAVPARLDLAPFLDAGEAEALLTEPGEPGVRAAATTQYSLCAVLIHHGTAQGGHYLAYVHDPVADRCGAALDLCLRPVSHTHILGSSWFDFNDTCVTEIPAAAMDAALRHAGERGGKTEGRAKGAEDGKEEEGVTDAAPAPAPAGAESEAEEAIRRALVTPDGRFASVAAPGFSSSVQATDEVAVPDSASAVPSDTGDSGEPAPSSEKAPLRRSALLASLPSSAYLLLYRRDDCAAGATSPAPDWLRREVEEESRRFTTLRRAFAVGRAMVHVRCVPGLASSLSPVPRPRAHACVPAPRWPVCSMPPPQCGRTRRARS